MIGLLALRQEFDHAIQGEDGDVAPVGLVIARLQRLRDLELLYGHELGDSLFHAMPERVREALRPGDKLIRIGEADCAVVFCNLRSRNHLELAAGRIARSFSDPVEIGERKFRVRVAVGAAYFPSDASDFESLLMAADRACSRAVNNQYSYEMHRSDATANQYEHERLVQAIRQNELQLYLQPIHSARSPDKIVAFESLARWPCEGGFVPPNVFIPMAERGGLIQDLTMWSLHSSLRLLSQWLEFAPDISVSVNISPLFAADPVFPDLVQRAMGIWNVPPERLILEITETAFAENADAVIDGMMALKRSGVSIAIDDFGTGYASFAYLKDFPVSELKIDQVFIRTLLHRQRLQHLVASMIDMSHRLGITAVAEGVEDQKTLEVLESLGCDFVQGYHLGRPALGETVVENLRQKYLGV